MLRRAHSASAALHAVIPERRRAGRAACCLVKVLVLVNAGALFELFSVWSWTYEYSTPTCEHPALPPNQSGIKALCYGPMKTGTKSISRALYKIGFDRSYHSEEFIYHIWTPIADRYWRRPENGGAWVATPFPPAWKGHMFKNSYSDLQILAELRREDLAEQISRCKVDSVVFDGIERLFWPVYYASPDVKVIILDWRTQKQWLKSEKDFTPLLLKSLFLLGWLQNSLHILPWSVLLLPAVEFLFDNQIDKLSRDGGPPFHAIYTAVHKYWHCQTNQRRMMEHWASGLCDSNFNSAMKWREYWETVRRIVPEKNRLSFDMKTMGYKELCKFLNVGLDSPACNLEGTLPKLDINILNFEREHPWTFASLVPVYLFFHYLNYKILFKLLPFLCGSLCCRHRKVKSA